MRNFSLSRAKLNLAFLKWTIVQNMYGLSLYNTTWKKDISNGVGGGVFLSSNICMLCQLTMMYKCVLNMCAPVAVHPVNTVWTDERGSVVWSNADLLAAGTSVCHSHIQV